MNGRAKKITILSVLAAASLITFLIENLFPPLFIPGAKLGLGNVFVMFALYAFGVGPAFVVLLVKCILGNLIVGNLSSMIFSLTAGVAGLFVMSVINVFLGKKITPVSLSVVGAVVNNLVQNVVYALITSTVLAMTYLPYLALIGIVSGLTVGFAVTLLLKKLPKKVFEF